MGRRNGSGVLSSPLLVLCARGMCKTCFHSQHPGFALNSSELAVGVFCPFCIFCRELAPTVYAQLLQLFLVSYIFLAFCCSRRLCPGVSLAALEQRAPGPTPSQKHTAHIWLSFYLIFYLAYLSYPDCLSQPKAFNIYSSCYMYQQFLFVAEWSSTV